MKLSSLTAHAAMIGLALTCGSAALAQEQMSKDEKIAQALRAGPPELTEHAAIVDWDGTVLRPGDNGWTCHPGPEHMQNSPMCLDEVWEKWGQAWMEKKPFTTDKVGVAYMLMGDDGSSNIDPFATERTDDNDWVVEGPHLMVLVPDAKSLESVSADPHNGGPYVMWKGTPTPTS